MLPRVVGPNRIYLGWHIAWVMFLSGGMTVGMTQYSFGLFAEPMESRFGWNRTEFNAALSFGFISSGLMTPVAGRLMDRYGVRPVMVFSLVLISAGFAMRPLVSDLWHWYLFNALAFAGLPGVTVLPAGKMVGLWFPKTQGRMMGVVISGNNFGGLATVSLATLLIAGAGWEWAFLAFGIIMAVVCVAALVVVRDGPDEMEAEARRSGRVELLSSGGEAVLESGLTLREALRSKDFYLIAFGLTAANFTYSGILTQIPSHLEHEGYSKAVAVGALTMVAAMAVGSKLVFGRLSESIGARNATAISVGLQMVGVVMMVMPGGDAPGMVWAAHFVYGLGFGGLGALIVLLVSESFGLREFGSIMGMVNMSMVISLTSGPLIVGALFDVTGGYQVPFGIISGAFALGIAALLLSKRRSERLEGGAEGTPRAGESGSA